MIIIIPCITMSIKKHFEDSFHPRNNTREQSWIMGTTYTTSFNCGLTQNEIWSSSLFQEMTKKVYGTCSVSVELELIRSRSHHLRDPSFHFYYYIPLFFTTFLCSLVVCHMTRTRANCKFKLGIRQ